MTLDSDLEELQESVQIISRQGIGTFGLSEATFDERKRFLRESNQALQVEAFPAFWA
jgi:uncharacterized protein (DUF2235 family)